jgi:hypothetical protein
MNDLINRMLRAAKLDVNLYEEVEADQGAMGQATLVVVLSSLAAGIGGMGTLGFGGIIISILTALIGWYIWAFLTYYIGSKFLPEAETQADHGEMLRTLGFSSSPGVIRVLGIIPGLYGIVNFIAAIWMLVAMVIAVRQALDYKSTVRAVIVCVIGFVIYIVVAMLIMMIIGMPSTV